MADKQVSVTLTGRDNLSPVFQKVGASATAAGKTIDAAGKSVTTLDKNATTAAQSMSRYEQAVKKAETATGKLGISGKAVGTAIGTVLSAGLLIAVRAAADAEASQARLSATIEATGSLFEQYGSQIDAVNNKALSLSFDDEDAQDALSGLIQATGDVELSMDQMGLAMDIARGRGIDLASATKIVIAADQERFTALKRLGIQIDENSTKESVLADLQQRYAGQAQAYADTNAGYFDRLQNSVENYAEAAGAALGPANQLLVVMPGLAGGFTLASAAAGALGISLIAVAPALLAIAIAAGAVYVGYEALTQEGNVTTQSMEDMTAGAKDVADALTLLSAAGDTVAVSVGIAAHNALTQAAKDMQEMFALTGEQATFQPGRANAEQQAAHDANMARLDELIAKYGEWDGAAGDVAGAESDLLTILTGSGALHEQQITALEATNKAYKEGSITFPQYIAGLDMVADMTGNVTTAAGTSTTAVQEYLDALNDVSDSGRTFPSTGAGVVATLGDIESQADKTARALAAIGNTGNNSRQTGSSAQTAQNLQNAIQSGRAAAEAAADAQAGLQHGIEGAADAMSYQVGEATKLADFYATEIPKATTAFTDSFNATTAAVTGTTQALDSGFRTAVTNTNAIADASQGVQDWADALIGASGTYATMDDLLQRGIITQEDYNAAQAAYTPIAEANLRIQDDVLEIQTKQAPVIAELAQAQADYMDSLANAPADQQMFALAMMDSATSAQALQLATSLLGENGDVFAPMVEQAANLNPYLAEIWAQMGLIEQQPDGTWTVTADTANAQSQLETLNDTIEKLVYTQLLIKAEADGSDAEAEFEELFGHAAEWDNTTSTSTADADTAAADEKMADVKAKLEDLNQYLASPDVAVDDAATGILAGVLSLLGQIDGTTATSYVNTVYQVSGAGAPGQGFLLAYGGTIPAMENGGTSLPSPYGTYSKAAANGLTATLVGERGPEVVMLPGGAQVMNTEGSRSRMRGGGGGGIQVHIHGNVYGLDDLTEKITDQISKAWVRANQQHERSMGW